MFLYFRFMFLSFQFMFLSFFCDGLFGSVFKRSKHFTVHLTFDSHVHAYCKSAYQCSVAGSFAKQQKELVMRKNKLDTDNDHWSSLGSFHNDLLAVVISMESKVQNAIQFLVQSARGSLAQ